VGKKGFFEKAREERTRQQARQKSGGTPPPKPRPQTDGPKRKAKAEEVKERVARRARNKKGTTR
jgi:hypothetical protein